MMATFTPITDSREKVREALEQVRKHRHQPDCECHAWRGLWCTVEEERWQGILDRLIDRVPKR